MQVFLRLVLKLFNRLYKIPLSVCVEISSVEERLLATRLPVWYLVPTHKFVQVRARKLKMLSRLLNVEKFTLSGIVDGVVW